MKTLTFLLLFALCGGRLPAQDAGTIRFTDASGQYLERVVYSDTANLNVQAHFERSLIAYWQAMRPGGDVQTFLQHGNWQFRFFVDDKLVYTENLHHGAGLPPSKQVPALSAPLISSKPRDHWGCYLWGRFLLQGGESALGTGVTHQLKIELRPYLQLDSLQLGPLAASGSVAVTVPPIHIDPAASAIQTIRPGSGWRTSPSSYDTALIRQLNEQILARRFKEITSIIVIRNGQLLLEEYFNGSDRDSLQDTRSVGKSFTSALMGIAIQEHLVKDEKQPLGTFYKLSQFDHYTPQKDSITLEQLLTMSSPFYGNDDLSDSPGNEENMYPTSNWVKFVLDLPLDSSRPQGKPWNYFTAGVVLLGDILQQSTPQGLEQYAATKLFTPLGIHHYQWQYTPQHVPSTAGGLGLRSLDLARFGQLYKNRGNWQGRQIIPASWVKASFQKRAVLPTGPQEYYGYLFWNKTFRVNGKDAETFYSSGNGGNKIFVFTNQPLVIVITATAYGRPYAHPQVDRMMREYLLPAVLP
ncbi:serine hydrolase [Chitinophaga parva]|uniref:Serine hydrolase n=1 Tax=Chitinophaga parva TaxID=2169414 RepID=A0A2T7BMY3_9BACT|nr:serine hydrolase [Chitinophaga parva]PUZ29000.1 serine hydrolase [Chitinophaga parva]